MPKLGIFTRVAICACLLGTLLAGCAGSSDHAETASPTPTVEIGITPSWTPSRTVIPSPSPAITLKPTTATGNQIIPTQQPASPAQPITTPPTAALIHAFAAEPDSADPGMSITLSWDVDPAADRVTLCRMMATGQYGTCWDVAPTGSQEVTIPPEWRNFITYTLGVAADEVDEIASVTITLSCPDLWYMPNPPDACPMSAPQRSAGSVQYFEQGLMIWRADQRLIYVLFSDGGSPAYQIIGDHWVEGMPECDPALTPPAGLMQPVRGFGLVWRGEAGYAGISDRLGWALGAEFSFQTAFQCDSASRYNDCYLLGPDGVIVLKPNFSAWAMWE